MNIEIGYMKIVITIVLTVIGWIVAHFFTTRRSQSLKRRDITVEHLIKSYRVLACEIAHRPKVGSSIRKLEDILSDIQLFGSFQQIEIAKKMAGAIAEDGESELDPLLNILRNDLRKELGLSHIRGNIQWLRYTTNR